MTFLAFLASAACFLGWPQKFHSGRALVGLLGVALAASVALAWLVAIAARMPRGAEETSERLLVYRVLAATEDAALAEVDGEPGPQLARIRLPEASVERFEVDGELGVIYQAVALDGRFAFTGRRLEEGGFRDYLGLLGPEGLVIAPGAHVAPAGHGLCVTLAPEGDAFVLVQTAREPAAATLSTLATDGGLTRRGVVPICDAIHPDAACFSGGALHLTGLGGAYVVEPDRCERLDAAGVTCPGATQHHRLAQVLAPDALRPRPPPPGGQTLTEVYTRFTAEGPVLVSEWITPDLHNVVDLGGGRALVIDYLTESETPGYGFVDDAAHFTLLEDGATVGESFIARWTFAGVKVFQSGRTLLVVDQDLDHRVRFDASTLERLEEPGLVPSVRARLGVWGGHSVVYEALVALALLLGALIWPLLPFLRGERLSRQRALVLANAILLPAVLTTLRRLFML